MEAETPVRVIIADDHDIYREGLQLVLSKEKDISILYEAEDGRALLELVEKHQPDVVLTDLRMPVMDGIRAIKEICKAVPSTKCIALSTFDSDNLIIDALEAGALGYIMKNAQKGEIADAIRVVYHGSPYYCKSTSKHLVRMISRSKFNPYHIGSSQLFSQKEIDIIRMICEEKTSKEIGEALFISTRTVEGYRVKILEKMNVKTSAGIAIYAIKNGLCMLDGI